MSDAIRKWAPLAVIMLLLAGGVIWALGSGSDSKTITAYFPRAVSVYEGSDVRVLGVAVGQVEEVVPEGTRVKVTMTYDDEVKVPMDAQAVIISPSVVGDRYIQLAPAYKDGEVLPDRAVLEEQRTAIPLELDEIYSSLDELTVALGPNGANAEGALTDLLEQTARNFGGQGAEFKQTIEDFGQLSTTLENNKEELFDSARQLQSFIETLAENDSTVRQFNSSLGRVSRLLDDERQELTSALSNLGVALDVVGGFVKSNRDLLSRNISGLNRITKVLADRQEELELTLRAGPLALGNLGLAYNPQTGTVDSNANIGNLVTGLMEDPALLLCQLISAQDPDGELCDLINTIPLGRSMPFGPGTGTWTDETYDPTLNGLVEVDR